MLMEYYQMGKLYLPPMRKPSLVTGEGHGHYHGPDMGPKDALKKKRKATKQKKQSRRRNRGK